MQPWFKHQPAWIQVSMQAMLPGLGQELKSTKAHEWQWFQHRLAWIQASVQVMLGQELESMKAHDTPRQLTIFL